jgi:hypothetical protein
MKKRTLVRAAAIVATAVTFVTLVPERAFAWGFAGHRLIMARAIDLLPPGLKPFFTHYRDEIVIRAVDPDLWRNVGWEEDPNHFLDFGAREFGEYPFTALPREYGAALEKFGIASLRRNGMLPWRLAEITGNMRRTFEAFTRGSAYGPSDLILFSATAGHYIQDAHQPFHATINYDGQLTGNDGIHSRFERDLIERFESRLTLAPAPPKGIANARDAAFDALLASYRLVDPILKADSDASAGKETYDDEYFEKFFVAVKPTLERRLAEAVTATAGLIIGAWEQAGKPQLALQGARPIQTKKKR